MTTEDVFLFMTYKIAKRCSHIESVSLTESLVPFEEIKKSFYNTPVSELEHTKLILLTKGLISGTESQVSMSFRAEMFTPDNCGDVKIRLTPDGFDRVMDIINIIKDIFCETYSLCKDNGYRPVVVDMVTLHKLEEKGLKDLEEIRCVDVRGRTGTLLFETRGSVPERRPNKPERVEIEITEDGLVFAHEHYQNMLI